MAEVKTIAIVTSGNDAPGMNSAIRAVTRSAIYLSMRRIRNTTSLAKTVLYSPDILYIGVALTKVA